MMEKYSKKGKNHSSFGKKSIVLKKENISKRIFPEEYPKYKALGWVCGGKSFRKN